MKEVLKQKPFSWNIRSISIEEEIRNLYLKALRQADNGDYSALLDFVRADWKNS